MSALAGGDAIDDAEALPTSACLVSSWGSEQHEAPAVLRRRPAQ